MYTGFIIHISSNNIVKIFSKERGIVSAFLKKSNNKEDKYKWQVGTYVEFSMTTKKNYDVIDVESNISFLNILFSNKEYMAIFNSTITILNNILIREQEVDFIYKIFYNLMFSYNNNDLILNYIDFLFNIVEYCGFYIDTSSSAISNSKDVYYISPKTANCITKQEGEKYKNKLFVIPQCFLYYSQDKQDYINAINILHYFIYKFCKDNYIEYKYKNIKFFKNQLIKILK